MRQSALEALTPEACRRVVVWPLGAAAGIFLGALSVAEWRVSVPVGVACGVAGAWLAVRVRDWLAARMAAAFSADPRSVLLAVSLDLGVGAVSGLAASEVLGASLFSTVASGAALAGLWSYVAGQMFCGGGVDGAVDFLLAGSQSSDFAAEPIVADGLALEREGHAEGAIRKYREVIERRPEEAEAYIRAAVLLRREGRAAEAAALLRQARRHAHLAPGQEVMIGHELADLSAGPLADRAAALAELTILADRFRGSPAGEAAARAAAEMRKGTAS